MISLDNLPTATFDAEPFFFRAALGPRCKKLIVKYLEELAEYIAANNLNWIEILYDLREVIDVAIQYEITKPTTSAIQLHSADDARRLRTGLIEMRCPYLKDFLSKIHAADNANIGLLYRIIPRFPHWEHLPGVRARYFKQPKHQICVEYYYCGYVRDSFCEANIRQFVVARERRFVQKITDYLASLINQLNGRKIAIGIIVGAMATMMIYPIL